MSKIGRGALVGIGLLLAACAAERPAQPVAVFDLRCDNGSSLHVAWWPEKAEVTYGAQHWTLPIAMSGSGARYADGVREVWEHQGIVSVTDGVAPPTSCR
ncbi:MAG: MliC family protein [Rhodospirillales bacterium]|nr:MliC family protein [Rhodospirillales bacterium]